MKPKSQTVLGSVLGKAERYISATQGEGRPRYAPQKQPS
jgi:hypothetical protein